MKESAMTKKAPARKAPVRRTPRNVKSAKAVATPLERAVQAGIGAASDALHMADEAVVSVVKKADLAMKKGRALRAKTRRAALHRAEEAKSMAIAGAESTKARAAEAVSQLEKVFQHRVSVVLTKMGVPTSQSIRTLTRQVSQLQANVDQLRRARGPHKA
jgi:poly(hydroxyalkanoate) granule-associated protein